MVQRASDIPLAEVPAAVMATAGNALAGYAIDPNEHPSLQEENGQVFYDVEVRRVGAGEDEEEVDLRIAPDGTFLGRD